MKTISHAIAGRTAAPLPPTETSASFLVAVVLTLIASIPVHAAIAGWLNLN